MLDFMLILSASASNLAWIITYINVVIRKKKALPAVIISSCFSFIFFGVAIAWSMS